MVTKAVLQTHHARFASWLSDSVFSHFFQFFIFFKLIEYARLYDSFFDTTLGYYLGVLWGLLLLFVNTSF